eukprot:3615765-Prymnesium_polylepis.2
MQASRGQRGATLPETHSRTYYISSLRLLPPSASITSGSPASTATCSGVNLSRSSASSAAPASTSTLVASA